MLVVCLLLLAASPVTAPFSTFDLGDVIPGSPLQVTSVKTKGSDHPHVGVAIQPEDSFALLDPEDLAGQGRCAQPRLVPRLIVPLRI